ncbi:putative N-acetyltransferase YhbS [Stakelama sediminis]|uniref:Putative N-acetyltransferase YhbS n=1 Tax=Stakelama sediminis TaxID=463200 RepID=A0A840YZL2_9SPHN|nr:N-acetyltransferase [Stakelama sediminis]MBB5718979.1 putative N-acetyltransferase YhbS [Stakelama sediminis]
MKPSLVPLDHIPPDAVEALLDSVFGVDRHQRTAYQVRDGMTAISSLSFAALAPTTHDLVGSIQCWPVQLTTTQDIYPLIMVGPVAVHPDHQDVGIGRALMWRVIELAAADTGLAGRDGLMLIGDPDYYGRLFGFSDAHTGGWRLPGPFERHRLLALGDAIPALPGIVGPRTR